MNSVKPDFHVIKNPAAARIRAKRAELRLKLVPAAKELGITYETLRRWEDDEWSGTPHSLNLKDLKLRWGVDWFTDVVSVASSESPTVPAGEVTVLSAYRDGVVDLDFMRSLTRLRDQAPEIYDFIVRSTKDQAGRLNTKGKNRGGVGRQG